MRIKKASNSSIYKILVLDDDLGIIDSLSIVLKRIGYDVDGTTSPLDAIGQVHDGNYDLLILDYMMEPINGDKVVEKIREFNKELYILLLTGHKDMAPPLETIKALDIQSYCEKTDKFDQLILLVESAIKSIMQMRIIKNFQTGLNRILEAVPKIYQLQPIGTILQGILVELMNFVSSENAFILVDDTFKISNTQSSIYKGIGQYNCGIEHFMSILDHDLMERIGYARSMQQIECMDTGIIFPLVNEYHQPMGVIYIESEDYKNEIKLLSIYANQAAAAINNAFLHSLVNTKNDELNRTYTELQKTYLDTIEALRMTVDAKDDYTCGHSDRVAFFSKIVGRGMNLSDEDIIILTTAGIFHDIGKIGTADDILRKSSKLTRDEYDIIKQHPLKGAHILSALTMFHNVVPLVKYHHEWYDGSGYPTGLKGEKIPLLARILSVSDAYDAMTSDRHYRTKMDVDHAKEQLISGKGTQFDPDIVDVFIREIVDRAPEIMHEIEETYSQIPQNLVDEPQ